MKGQRGSFSDQINVFYNLGMDNGDLMMFTGSLIFKLYYEHILDFNLNLNLRATLEYPIFKFCYKHHIWFDVNFELDVLKRTLELESKGRRLVIGFNIIFSKYNPVTKGLLVDLIFWLERILKRIWSSILKNWGLGMPFDLKGRPILITKIARLRFLGKKNLVKPSYNSNNL